MSEEIRPDEPMAENQDAPEAVAEDQVNDQTVAENGEQPADADGVEALRQELAAAQAKADDYLDKWQRAAAEFQNLRRRLEQQQADAVERANSGLILRLLPVLDDFEAAFQNAEKQMREAGFVMGGAQPAESNGASGESERSDAVAASAAMQLAWLEGFRQIQKKLLDQLIEQGVSVIEGDGEFDPERHEAISSEPHDDVESGHVIDVLRAGYVYKGRVLRPALVRVAM